MSKIIPVYDRSRVLQDWKCPRSRYWNYEYGGQGIAPQTTSLELFMGITVHDALAAIAVATQHGLPVDIDTLATTAYRQMFEALDDPTLPPDGREFAKEQASLVEGMLRGFYRVRWPQLLAQYPRILLTEDELMLAHDGLRFMSKPDLVMANDDETVYVEYKTTSSKKDAWVNSWQTAVQLHSTVRAIKATHGIDVNAVIVQGLYKGYECLAPDTPVLTADLRWVPVGSLIKGDKLAGFDAEPKKISSGVRNGKRQWKVADVLHVGRQTLPAYALTLSDGTSFTCSENHLWLVSRNSAGTGSATWVKTKDLTKGCHLLKVAEVWKEDTSRSAGYLAASFDGEGNLSQHNVKDSDYWLTHLAFTQKDNPMLTEVKSLLTKHGFSFGQNDRRGSEKIGGIYLHGQSQVMRFLGSIRPKRLLPKFSLDKLGGVTVIGKPLSITKLEFVGEQEVVTLGTSTETLVANGIATHNSYGKQSSPFCYAYMKKGHPPFSQDEISYNYAAGYRRTAVWDLPGGVKKWVEDMPEVILGDQFPQTPPIYIKDDLVDSFFRQRDYREHEVATAMEEILLLEKGKAEGLDPIDADEEIQSILDDSFPQRFEQCVPSFGRECAYRRLCHGPQVDPLQSGYVWREPHHKPEVEFLRLRQEARNESE